jgi:hypothetical protein
MGLEVVLVMDMPVGASTTKTPVTVLEGNIEQNSPFQVAFMKTCAPYFLILLTFENKHAPCEVMWGRFVIYYFKFSF